jgi:CMP-N-acetylneuraminic acid synthetase
MKKVCELEGMDIDTELDFKIAELLYRELNGTPI